MLQKTIIRQIWNGQKASLGRFAATVVSSCSAIQLPSARPTRLTAWLALAGVIGAITIGASPARALGLVDGSRFDGPPGWRTLCEIKSEFCNRAGNWQRSAGEDASMALLSDVNAKVNNSIKPVNEPAGQDVWSYLPASGDCDDYALSKKIELIKKGIHPASLRFATAFTESGEYHVVLKVESGLDVWVLDNRFADPMRWEDLERHGYSWIAIEGMGADGAWALTATGYLLNTFMSREMLPASGS